MKLFYGLLFVFSFAVNGIAQDSTIYHNSIKLTAFPFLRPLTTSHARIIGIEYKRRIKPHLAIIERVDFGSFLNYSFTRYYNHLQNKPQDCTKNEITVIGYHSITSIRIILKTATYFLFMVDLCSIFINIFLNQLFYSSLSVLAIASFIFYAISMGVKSRIILRINK